MSGLIDVTIVDEGFENTPICTDSDTLQGIASFIRVYSKSLAKRKIKVMIEDQTSSGSSTSGRTYKPYKPDKKFLFEKDVRKIPQKINSSMKYFIVIRNSKSYNIYTFDSISFLNGIYIGIGLCKEEYQYIIRGVGDTDDLIETSEHDLKVENETKIEKEEKKLVEIENNNEEDEKKEEEIVQTKIERTNEGWTEVKEEKEEEKKEETEVKEEEKKETPLIIDSVQETLRKRVINTRRSPTKRNNNPNFDNMKLDELKKYANNHDINIKGLTKKSEIVDKVKSSSK